MKNVVPFRQLASALSQKGVEPVIEIVGLVKTSDDGSVHLDLAMEGEEWVPLRDSDVHDEVEHLGEQRLKDSKHATARFRLRKSASQELLWAVIRDLQNSLDSARNAYENELRKKGRQVMTGDTMGKANCSCRFGNKCCCPEGWECCNYDKRCCCQGNM